MKSLTTCFRIGDENNAAGQKITKKVYDTPNNELKEVDYLDGFQYAGGILQFFPHAEGYVNVTESKSALTAYIFNYVYNYTDHLGNIRMSYTKDPLTSKLRILEENHYYPFGLKHSVYNSAKMKFKEDQENQGEARPVYVYKTDYQYKFGNKELQDELGLNVYDFGARVYDPAAPRFWQIDPLAEEYSNWSPYAYVMNNPLRYSDPTGMKGDDFIDIDKKTGSLKVTKAEGNDQVRLVEDGKVVDSYEYGENGSFMKENNVETLEGKGSSTEQGYIVNFADYNKANTFFEFAAQSDVEFGLVDMFFSSDMGAITSVITNGDKDGVGASNLAHDILSKNKDAYILEVKHSHPGEYNPITHYPAAPSGFDLRTLKPTNQKGDRQNYDRGSEYNDRRSSHYNIYIPGAPNVKVKYNGEEAIRTKE